MKPFQENDHVYYFKKEGDTFVTVPSMVLKVYPKTLKIKGDFPFGDKVVRVKKQNCELQNNNLSSL